MSSDTQWFGRGNCTPHCCNFSFMHVWMVTYATINRPGLLTATLPRALFSPLTWIKVVVFFCVCSEKSEVIRLSVLWVVAQQRCWSGCSGGDIIVCLSPLLPQDFCVICPLWCIVLTFCFCLNRWMEPQCCNTARKESGNVGWSILIYCVPHFSLYLFI